MDSSFNSGFYITAAAAIPLFYLAVFVQDGNVIADTGGLIKSGIAFIARLTRNRTASTVKYVKGRGQPGIRGIGFRSFLTVAFLFPFLLSLFTLFILATVGFLLMAAVSVGVLSEGISLWALFYQSDNIFLREIVLWTMLGLLGVMSVKPTAHVIELSWSSIFSREPPAQTAPDMADRAQRPGELVPMPRQAEDWTRPRSASSNRAV